ncbi:MAG: Zn-ribbon containing protein [Halolamina sp.]
MPHQCVNCGRTFGDGSKEMLSGCPDCDGKKFQFQPSDAADRPTDATAPTGGVDESEPTPTTDAGATTSEADDEFGVTMETADSSTLAGTTDDSPADTTDADPSSDADIDPDANRHGSTADVATDNRAADSTNGTDADIVDTGSDADGEDDAQATARSSVVDTDELSAARQARAEAERERLAEVDDPATGEEEDRPTTGDGAAPEEPADDATDDSPSAAESPDLAALREELNSQFESIKITAPGQYELNLMELYDREEYIVSLQEDGRYVIEVPESWHGDEPE